MNPNLGWNLGFNQWPSLVSGLATACPSALGTCAVPPHVAGGLSRCDEGWAAEFGLGGAGDGTGLRVAEDGEESVTRACEDGSVAGVMPEEGS